MLRFVPLLAAPALLIAGPSLAAPAALGISKTSTVMSDQVNTLNPKVLPGSVVDYAMTVTNPVANAASVVKGEVITEPIAAGVVLRVSDLGASGSGPIEFADGNLLGSGLLATGLTYTFRGLVSTSDDVEFSDGVSWAYVPVPDAAGFDAKVRQIRVTLRGTHSAGTSFRLRYRVVVK